MSKFRTLGLAGLFSCLSINQSCDKQADPEILKGDAAKQHYENDLFGKPGYLPKVCYYTDMVDRDTQHCYGTQGWYEIKTGKDGNEEYTFTPF